MPAAPKTVARTATLPTTIGPLRVAYLLERTARSRRVRLVLDLQGELVLKVPTWVAEAEATRFLESQGDWILRARRRRPPTRTLREHLADKPALTAHGASLPVLVRDAAAGARPSLRAGSAGIVVDLPPGSDEATLAQLLRGYAARVLPPRVHALAAARGLAVGGVSVRDQIGRWGSCSARRHVSLNWRLVLLPPALQDYVILHELAHLTHLHHRAEFWELLAAYDPEATANDALLTRVGLSLMALGRPRRGSPPAAA